MQVPRAGHQRQTSQYRNPAKPIDHSGFPKVIPVSLNGQIKSFRSGRAPNPLRYPCWTGHTVLAVIHSTTDGTAFLTAGQILAAHKDRRRTPSPQLIRRGGIEKIDLLESRQFERIERGLQGTPGSVCEWTTIKDEQLNPGMGHANDLRQLRFDS